MGGLVSKLDLGRLACSWVILGTTYWDFGVNSQIKIMILKGVFNVKKYFELEKIFEGVFKSRLYFCIYIFIR